MNKIQSTKSNLTRISLEESKLLKRSVLCVLLILVFQQTFTQNPTNELKGTITSATNGKPISDVNIYTEDKKRGTITDSKGHFKLELAKGIYTIIIDFSGYKTEKLKVDMSQNRTLNVSLSESNVNLDEVVITGESDKNVRGLAIGLKTIKVEEIKTLPTFLGQTDIVKTLLLLPGVSSIGEGASGFNVRGGKVGQNLVLFNGAQLFNSSHVLGLFSSFNADAIESFDLYKGHIPARFGGRLSAVLDIKEKEGDFNTIKFDASLGLLTTKVLMQGPIINDKTSFLVSGRVTYSDWILTLVNNPDIKNSSVAFHDINANITHKFNENNKFSMSYYRSNDRFQFSDAFGFNYETNILSAKWKTNFNSKLSLDVNGSYGNYDATSFDPEGFDAFNLDTGIDYINAKGMLSYKYNDNYTLRVGGEWSDFDITPEQFQQDDSNGNAIIENIDKEQAREFSIFLENDIQVFPWLSFSLGGRYTMFQNYGPYEVFNYQEGLPIVEENATGSTVFGSGETIQEYSGFEPRASALFQVGKHNSVKLSYNRTRQYIHSVTNSASPTPADLWQLSNRYFKPQVADNYSLGYFHNFNNNRIEASLEGFYKDINNQVEYRDFAQLFLNNQLETELAVGKGKAYGIEFLLNKKSGDWTGWLSYAYTRSFVTVNNPFPEETINNGIEFPSNFDQPHKFNIVIKKELGKKSAFSASLTYITGRPITAIGSSFNVGPTVVPVFTERNGERIPDFIRLDASFTVAENIFKGRIVKKPNKRFKDNLSISFYNLLSRKNAFSVFYQRSNDELLPVAKRLSVIGSIIPSLTYNVSF